MGLILAPDAFLHVKNVSFYLSDQGNDGNVPMHESMGWNKNLDA
jgi:hypothetical protein